MVTELEEISRRLKLSLITCTKSLYHPYEDSPEHLNNVHFKHILRNKSNVFLKSEVLKRLDYKKALSYDLIIEIKY